MEYPNDIDIVNVEIWSTENKDMCGDIYKLSMRIVSDSAYNGVARL